MDQIQDPLDIRLSNDLIYVLRFSDDGFVIWKPLIWNRYKRYRNIVVGNLEILHDIEDKIFDECVLEHNYGDISLAPAGVVTTIAQLILYYSGFSSARHFDQILKSKRDIINSAEEQIPLLICRAFPGYKLSEIEDMTFDEIAKHLAIVEQITGSPISLDTPDKKKSSPAGGLYASGDQMSGVAVSAGQKIDFEAENRALKQVDRSAPVAAGNALKDRVGRDSNWEQIEQKESIMNKGADLKKAWEKQQDVPPARVKRRAAHRK